MERNDEVCKSILLSLRHHLTVPKRAGEFDKVTVESSSDFWCNERADDDVFLFVYKRVVRYIMNDDVVSLSSLFFVLEQEGIKWSSWGPVKVRLPSTDIKYGKDGKPIKFKTEDFNTVPIWSFLIFGQALGNVDLNGIFGTLGPVHGLQYYDDVGGPDDRLDPRTQTLMAFRASFLPKNEAWRYFFHLYMLSYDRYLDDIICLLPMLHYKEAEIFRHLLVPYLMLVKGQNYELSE